MTNKDNRVQLGGKQRYEEFDAEVATGSADIRPGMLVEVTQYDDDGTIHVQPHSTDGASGSTSLLFADIVPYSGDIESDTPVPVEDPYTEGDYLKVIGCQSFHRVNAILAAGADLVTAGDATITEGEALTSAGDGTLRDIANAGGTPLVRAREAVDNSGASAGDDARLIVEAL